MNNTLHCRGLIPLAPISLALSLTLKPTSVLPAPTAMSNNLVILLIMPLPGSWDIGASLIWGSFVTR